MTTTNTPFEDEVDKVLGAFVGNYKNFDETKAALTQLHKAAIVAELEQFDRPKCICNETDTAICDSYWHHSNAVAARIEAYRKESE